MVGNHGLLVRLSKNLVSEGIMVLEEKGMEEMGGRDEMRSEI